MTEQCERIMKEFYENAGTGYCADNNLTLKIMELRRLDRIAEALEDINCTLTTIGGSVEMLEKLGDCVDTTPGYGERLIISGNVHV